MMNYEALEALVRRATCKTLGANSENLDRWLVTNNANQDLQIPNFRLPVCVEVSFDPEISPFNYVSSFVGFYVSLPATNPLGVTPADIQFFFGHYCNDVDSAVRAASAFLERDESDGWYVESEFCDSLGLHLRYRLGESFKSEADFERAVENALAELCDNALVDQLRPFIHYFEGFESKSPERQA